MKCRDLELYGILLTLGLGKIRENKMSDLDLLDILQILSVE